MAAPHGRAEMRNARRGDPARVFRVSDGRGTLPMFESRYSDFRANCGSIFAARRAGT
jgi:hypothetical protein